MSSPLNTKNSVAIIYSISAISLLVVSLVYPSCRKVPASQTFQENLSIDTLETKPNSVVLDTASYYKKLILLSNGDTTGRWPVKSALPLPGAILPFHRIVAYYGNLYSKQMGILGEVPPEQMLRLLLHECKKWEKADSLFPVKPALHYIALTAQTTGSRMSLRMPFHQIDSILALAKKIDALVFLDLQLGWSNLSDELPRLEKYLSMPQVHLGIDPEFAMQNGKIPGSQIGSLDASEVNYASHYLRKLVQKHQLPPKLLIVHRFTKNMLTGSHRIKTSPEVQLVIHMDGFGARALKKNTYRSYIFPEPVQFTGFKIFYKNDARLDPKGILNPEDLLDLRPIPSYIQYQ